MPTNPSTTILRPGDKIDQFEIVEQIAGGGMSVVWKGYDRLLDRAVAIKQIAIDHPAAANEEAFREQFRQEAQLQKRVAGQHKNLVHIYDFVEDPRGLFIVLEYVDGQSLEQLLATTSGPLDQTLAIGIIGAVALALRALHQEKIVHRDLKPANILLPKAGGLKICDFGLATLLTEQDALALGSVRYMAPECFGAAPVDARADIYALGMVSYEMLAGRDKFNEAFKIVLRDQRNQALRWMKWHTNPRASVPPLHELTPTLPKKLSDLVGRMMEKDPGKRIASADELLGAIRRHFTGQPHHPVAAGGDLPPDAAPAPPSAPVAPTAPLPKPNRLPYLLAGLLGFWLLVGLGLWWWLSNAPARVLQAQRNVATAAFTAAQDRFDKQHDYAGTRPLFENLAQVWQRDNLGRASRAYALFCQADALIQAKDYDPAIQALNAAEKLGVLDRDLVYARRNEALARQAANRMIADIETQIAHGHLNEARYRRQQALKVSDAVMTDEERQRLEDLGAQIEGQAVQLQVNQILTDANRMATRGLRDQAIQRLEKETDRYHSPELTALLNKLKQDNDYENILANVVAAERRGNWTVAMVESRRALKIRPEDKTVAANLVRFQGNAAYEEGVQQEQAGNSAAARAAYLQAVDNKDAEAALARLKTADQRGEYLRAADEAMTTGNYTVAIPNYQKALDISTDAATVAKLRSAQVNQLLDQARSFIDADKVAEARAALLSLRKIDAENPTARELTSQLDQQQEYQRHLAKGDEYRRQSKYAEAKLEYRRVKDLRDSPEIKQRLDDVEYDSLLAAARRDIAGENWAAAKAWLKTAQSIRDTEEVRQLQNEAYAKEPKKEEN